MVAFCRYGQFEVKTANRVELSRDITVRELWLTHQERQETRKVMHYHYHAWPDHGVPTATEPLRQLSALLRSTKGSGTPVVHCSAGELMPYPAPCASKFGTWSSLIARSR